MEFITNVMLFEDSIEELNVIGFCLRETMSELFSLHFFPSTLLLSCALQRDMYQETSKYWSSKARFCWLWTARMTWWHGGKHAVISKTQSTSMPNRNKQLFFFGFRTIMKPAVINRELEETVNRLLTRRA